MVLDRRAKARAQAEVWAEAVGQVQVVEAGGAAEGSLWARGAIASVLAVGQLRLISVRPLATK